MSGSGVVRFRSPRKSAARRCLPCVPVPQFRPKLGIMSGVAAQSELVMPWQRGCRRNAAVCGRRARQGSEHTGRGAGEDRTGHANRRVTGQNRQTESRCEREMSPRPTPRSPCAPNVVEALRVADESDPLILVPTMSCRYRVPGNASTSLRRMSSSS